jgi:YD repeat-containing protein
MGNYTERDSRCPDRKALEGRCIRKARKEIKDRTVIQDLLRQAEVGHNGVLTETTASVVNPEQDKIITNTYDEVNGNLLATTETGLLGNGSPYSHTTTYAYNASGKLATIDGPRTDVSDVTTYTYDPSTGNLLAVAQPIVGTTTYSNHDALGGNLWGRCC